MGYPKIVLGPAFPSSVFFLVKQMPRDLKEGPASTCSQEVVTRRHWAAGLQPECDNSPSPVRNGKMTPTIILWLLPQVT